MASLSSPGSTPLNENHLLPRPLTLGVCNREKAVGSREEGEGGKGNKYDLDVALDLVLDKIKS
jgi:hypothetical protein